MAKNSFNFQAKLGLETKDFKRGARDAKGILNGLQSDFRSFAASLIAGLSIGNIFDKMKDSALELSNALNTLKNVSDNNGSVLDGYASNLEFVRNLAEKYGQNILSLSDAYAKFAAASRSSNMTLEDQQKVFASLTRAAGYFHLSADQTRDMMNAVIQMMSKGKIASEELRRQLGNTLPGAFDLMAKAMKVSTADLESMMKKGEVLAEKVLPDFAKELDKVTAGGNFDNLQASINKLQNAWLDFVQKSGFANFFKMIIDLSTKGLSVVTKNVDSIGRNIMSILGTGLVGVLHKYGQKSIVETETAIRGIEARIRNFNHTLKKYEKENGEHYAKMLSLSNGGNYFAPNKSNLTERELTNIKRANEELLELNKLKKKAGRTDLLSDVDIKNIKIINDDLKTTPKLFKNATTAVKVFGKGLNYAAVAAKNVAKQFVVFFLINEAINLVIRGVEKLIEVAKAHKTEQERIASILQTHDDYIDSSVKNSEEEVKKAEDLLDIIKNQNISLAGRKDALNRLADLTGNIKLKDINIENIKEGTKEYLKLADAIDVWGEALIKNAYVEAYAQEAARAGVEVDKLIGQLTELEEKGVVKSYSMKQNSHGVKGDFSGYIINQDADKDAKRDAQEKINTLNTQKQWLNRAEKQMSSNIEQYNKLKEQYRNAGNQGLGDEDDFGGSKAVKSLKDVHEDFLNKERELRNQLKEGAISQKQFNDDFNDLLISTWKSAAATGEMNLAELSTKSNLTALEAFYVMLARQATIAMGDTSKEIIKQWEDELMDEIERMGQEIDDYFEKEVAQQNIVFDIHAGKYDAKKDTRNSLFDYKKTMSDIYDENLNITEKYIDDLEGKYKDLNDKLLNTGDYSDKITIIKQLVKLQEQIKLAKKEATGFEDLMNLSIIEEDIKELSKELAIGIWDSARNIVGGLDAITQAHKNLKETLDDKDSTGWEKFIASFELLGSVIDGVIGSFETFSELMKIATMLSGAEEAKSIALGKVKDKETASIIANTSAKGANLATTTAAAGATAAEAGATTALALAKEKEAMATAIAAAAKMGYPALLGTIPSAAAVVKAALASLQAFEKGGIVGGNSTRGDRNIIRANTGEMILNKAQQGTLWNMLNGKGGIGGNVQFKIKGADLVGTINNYNNRRRG